MLNDGNDRKHQPGSRSERYGLQKPSVYDEFKKELFTKAPGNYKDNNVSHESNNLAH